LIGYDEKKQAESMIKLKVVEQRKLYVQIADQLRELIRTGDAKPGQQLPSERELAQSLGVSRPTVREALIALEVAGLVEVRVGIGAFVRTAKGNDAMPGNCPSPTEVMELRLLLEPKAAALAAVHIDAAQTARLKANIASIHLQSAGGPWDPVNDREFHLIIAQSTGNSAMFEIPRTSGGNRRHSRQITEGSHRHQRRHLCRR